MGYRLDRDGFARAVAELAETYRVLAPVVKTGKGRFTDTDVILYDEVKDGSEIELIKKSDYSFKEALTPLSETLFFFTENQVKEAFLRPACPETAGPDLPRKRGSGLVL